MVKTTHAFLRIIERKYANDFINKGIIKFGLPEKWLKMGLDGNDTIGDKYEGAYCIQSENNEKRVILRKGILQIPTLCFYGINDTSFSPEAVIRGRQIQYEGKVSGNYFNGFNQSLTKEQYEKIPLDLQPVTIMIFRPELFVERLKNKLMTYGVRESEIIALPVEYVHKNESFFFNGPYPFELFLKDSNYSEQNEIRILINTTNSEFLIC